MAVALSACDEFERRETGPGGTPLESYTAKQIYERGEYELESDDNEDAAFYFGEVERLYPYSEWAKRALIRASALPSASRPPATPPSVPPQSSAAALRTGITGP